MRFLHVRLEAPAPRLHALADFYGQRLGLDVRRERSERLSVVVGESELEFVGSPGEAFYHFALLVPGNRFAAALEWARTRVELLPDTRSGEVLFDFDSWAAEACYFHDPAGNIVELIAHRGIAETSNRGEFRASELVGLSELGLVGEPPALAELLASSLGLELWDGSLEAGDLAFVGERARTLILAPPDRGWLPTGRPAELHNVEVLLSGSPKGEVLLESRYRISRSGSSPA